MQEEIGPLGLDHLAVCALGLAQPWELCAGSWVSSGQWGKIFVVFLCAHGGRA